MLEDNRSLAEALSAAFQQAWADLDAYVSYAAETSVPAPVRDRTVAAPAAAETRPVLPGQIPLALISPDSLRMEAVSRIREPDSAASEIHLDLSGAGEELQSFLQDIAVSDAKIPAALDLTEASEELTSFQVSLSETDAALPLRLDRTRADLSLSELQRLLRQPLSLAADTSGVISAASSALSSIRAAYAASPLQLSASVVSSAIAGLPDASAAAAAGTPAASVSRSVEAPLLAKFVFQRVGQRLRHGFPGAGAVHLQFRPALSCQNPAADAAVTELFKSPIWVTAPLRKLSARARFGEARAGNSGRRKKGQPPLCPS